MEILQAVKNLKNRLTTFGNREPLNFFSIVLILGLDLFVLINLFQGLDLQVSQLTQPSEVISYQCLEHLNEKEQPNNEEKRRVVTNLLNQYNNYYSPEDTNQPYAEPKCLQILSQANLISQQPELLDLYSQITELEQNINDNQNTINDYENNYETMLLEDIAGQPEDLSITPGNSANIKQEIAKINLEIQNTQTQVENLYTTILNHTEVQKLFTTIELNQAEILSRSAKLNFWYPLKKITVELFFLTPLLLVFFFLYRRALNRNNSILILIYAHLLVVISIPLLFEICALFLDILPFHFLADLLQLLEDLHLVVLWNYLLILFGILVTIGLIYFIQKKLFSRERANLKRIAKGECTNCGINLNENAEYCYACGAKQLIPCPHCQKLTYQNGNYCQNCGNNFRLT